MVWGVLSKSCFLESELGFKASLGSFLLRGERLAMLVIEASFGFLSVGFGTPFFSVGDSIKRLYIRQSSMEANKEERTYIVYDESIN